MKLLLTKAARINCNAGEIVEVSSAQADFLLAVGAAVPVADQKAERERKEIKKAKKGK